MTEEVNFLRNPCDGDIVPSVLEPVPPASKEVADVKIGHRVLVKVWHPLKKKVVQTGGLHFGDGVVLLYRDHERIEPHLLRMFQSK